MTFLSCLAAAGLGCLTLTGVGIDLRFMWLLPLLVVCALPVQGDLKLTLEPAVYPDTSGGAVLELSYEIPYTSLAFVRESGAFVSRYRVGIQVLDARRNLVAGDMWQRAVTVNEYDRTVARDSVETGMVRLAISKAAAEAEATVSDLGSDRRASAAFRVTVPTGGMMIRLLRSGQVFFARKYGLDDTIEAVALVLADEKQGQAGRIDSCRFAVQFGGRNVVGAVVPTFDSSGHRAARFAYPMRDSTGAARLGGGEYTLEATGLGVPGLRASVTFRVDVPFFLDDEVWKDKVDKLLYVATQGEMQRLRALPRQDREKAWREFWKSKDRTPTTERNEREEEYFERIEYAQDHFSHGDRGYKSDRARVYVRYGPPDQIESRPFEIDSPACETWYYYQLNLTFVFVDRFGTGEFRLQNPEILDER